MARTPEAKVKAQVRTILNQLIERGVPLYYFSPASNGYGRAGIPDFIGCIRGRFFSIECKAGKGTLTALQQREANAIVKSEGMWYLADETTVDGLRTVLGSM